MDALGEEQPQDVFPSEGERGADGDPGDGNGGDALPDQTVLDQTSSDGDEGESAATEDAYVQEIAQLQDSRLRLQAEFDNYRRRTRQQMDDMRQTAAEDLVLQLLPVIDNLERAIAAAANDPAARGYTQGVEMIIKQFLSVLSDIGVSPIPAVGVPFDPHVHEAVATEHTPDVSPGYVCEELQRGYTLNGKVLRAGQVKVAAGPGGEEENANE